MPTKKPGKPRLNVSLNEEDIKELNKIRQELEIANQDKSPTYAYVDIIRLLIGVGRNLPHLVADISRR